MSFEGFFHLLNNFISFILSFPDQPRKIFVFAGAILLVNVLVAVIDWKWGRGVGFTILALLAGAFSVYVTVIFLQVMQRHLDLELKESEYWWVSLSVYLDLLAWYALELPIILGLGVGAVVLAALSRQRGWIIGNAVALALTILAPFLVAWVVSAIQAETDDFSLLATHNEDVRMFQAHLAFVFVLLAFQLIYLVYGVWRIWRSRTPGSRSRSANSAVTTP